MRSRTRGGCGGSAEREGWPCQADALGDREQGEGVGEAATVGGAQFEVELEQGNQDEATRQDLGVGQREAWRGVLDAGEQEDVDVDRTGSVAWAARAATELCLDRLAGAEQVLGGEAGRRCAGRR